MSNLIAESAQDPTPAAIRWNNDSRLLGPALRKQAIPMKDAIDRGDDDVAARRVVTVDNDIDAFFGDLGAHYVLGRHAPPRFRRLGEPPAPI
jgi:hypothetical protein